MDSMSDPISDAKNDAPGSDGKLKEKKYERELARLHVELVKLQQWVVHKGLRVCIRVVFATAPVCAHQRAPRRVLTGAPKRRTY
jgi:polyphosphate kinase 2 (PPK2 family)